jgi:hypothetical protein
MLVLGSTHLTAQSTIKCWTNHEGVRECGNRVPPEFAQKGHQELNQAGMIINEQSRALTTDELAARALEMEKLAEQERIRENKAREDQVLLATFSTIDEIELVRDERLQVIQARITLAEKQIETIKTNLDQHIQTAAMAERNGQTPEDVLLNDIKSLERQIELKFDYIAQRSLEIDNTNAEYAAKIDRFKELRGLY